MHLPIELTTERLRLRPWRDDDAGSAFDPYSRWEAARPTDPLRPSGDTEIGWRFHPDHWGRGYATEAAGALLDAALEDGLPAVVAVTCPENTASQRVCERIGMRRVGPTDAYSSVRMELFARP